MAKLPSVKIAPPGPQLSELVVLGCFQRRPPETTRLPRSLANAASKAIERQGWKGVEKQVVRMQTRTAEPSMVAVHGLGPVSAFDTRKLCMWLGRAIRLAREEGCSEILVVLPEHEAARGNAALRVLLQLSLTGYSYDEFRKKEQASRLRSIQVLPPSSSDETYRKSLKLVTPLTRSVTLARDLANTPPNEANPNWMAEKARSLARNSSMKFRVLGPKELERQGMGALLAVGGGSSSPPRLVRLEWGDGEPVIAFVGKGVTFDTGGISIKPSSGMDEMKYDKSGACTVMGIAQATADLDLPFRFRAYLPLAENMPDGASYRPGDIVRCFNGKTVEIGNTDAEGRMILADALAWAAEEKPDTLLEYSTLTGASVVALGHHSAALYTPDDPLAAELLAASAASGERLWRMPLWPEFQEEMKGNHADLRNVAGRWGGANTAAAFLSNFVGSTRRWAHLDIAATAYVGSYQKGPQGATGYGVALTAAWLLEQAGRL